MVEGRACRRYGSKDLTGFRNRPGLEGSDSMTESVRLSAVVHGYVQGVSFRYYTRQRAQALGVTGYARNQWDGTVEVVAEGPRPALEDLLDWLHRGPPAAAVTHVDATWGPATGEFTSFGVRF